MKDKDKNKEPISKEQINNININSDDKLEKNKVNKCATIVDKNDKKYENTQKSNLSESKKKKNKFFFSNENTETLVQVEEKKYQKNHFVVFLF